MDASLLRKLKVGLGILPSDPARDEWLTLRADGLLAQMRSYTNAPLFPLRQYRDVFHGRWRDSWMEGLTPKHGPIYLITAININGLPIDDLAHAQVTTDNRIVLRNDTAATCYWPSAYASDVEVFYQAGYPAMPSDLFEALLALVQQAFAGIDGDAAALAGVSKLTLVDVGSFELKPATTFTELLGPFGAVLDRYSWHAMVGAPLVVESYDLGPVPTVTVSAVAPDTAAAGTSGTFNVTGTFQPGDAIVFDGEPLATTFTDSSTLEAQYPPLDAGDYVVQVRRGPLLSEPDTSPRFTFT